MNLKDNKSENEVFGFWSGIRITPLSSRYQISSLSGAHSCPIHLMSYWRCEEVAALRFWNSNI